MTNYNVAGISGHVYLIQSTMYP